MSSIDDTKLRANFPACPSTTRLFALSGSPQRIGIIPSNVTRMISPTHQKVPKQCHIKRRLKGTNCHILIRVCQYSRTRPQALPPLRMTSYFAIIQSVKANQPRNNQIRVKIRMFKTASFLFSASSSQSNVLLKPVSYILCSDPIPTQRSAHAMR